MTIKQKADQILVNECSIIKTRFSKEKETLGSDNLLIKELPIVIDVEDLKRQFQEEERPPTPVHYQSEEKYYSRSESSPTSLNESENN